MYICYCPLRDPNWNTILYCIVLYNLNTCPGPLGKRNHLHVVQKVNKNPEPFSFHITVSARCRSQFDFKIKNSNRSAVFALSEHKRISCDKGPSFRWVNRT